MSLLAPQETSGISYDIFDSGVDTTACGTVQIKLYIPKTVGSGAGSFINTYSMNVTNVGEVKANFDMQDSLGDLDTFEFNVPSFKFGAHDPVASTSTNDSDTLVDLISEAMMRMPVGYVATIELTVNGSTTYFYAQKKKTSFKVLERDIEFEGVHPMALAVRPFGKPLYENTTYSQSDFFKYRGYIQKLGNFSETTNTSAGTITLPGNDGIAYATISAAKFIKDLILHLADGGDSIIYDSNFFTDNGVDFAVGEGEVIQDVFGNPILVPGQQGNVIVLMCGEFGVVEANQDINRENITAYPEDIDNFVAPYPSVFRPLYAFNPNTDVISVVPNDHISLDAAIEYFIKMARCDAAIFGSILGETFYMPRSNKDSQYNVSLSSDEILSVDIKQDPVNPKTFDFDYLVMRSTSREQGFYSSSLGSRHISNMTINQTINQSGTHEVDISFAPATTVNGPDYSNVEGGNNAKGQMIFKAAANDAGNTFGVQRVVAPFYYDTEEVDYEASFYEKRYAELKSSDAFSSYKKAVKFGDGTTVKCKVVGIDTIKPYSVISFDSAVHPEFAGKDFRVSKISYKLDEDIIEFEAYEF